jgi:hypothetical protein
MTSGSLIKRSVLDIAHHSSHSPLSGPRHNIATQICNHLCFGTQLPQRNFDNLAPPPVTDRLVSSKGRRGDISLESVVTHLLKRRRTGLQFG